MATLPEPIATLISALNRLPGIGPRSAERLALHLVQSDAGEVKQLAEMLIHAREKIRTCTICGALTEQEPCTICQDPRRDGSLIGVEPEDLRIAGLEKRAGVEPVREIIIALGTDVEGDATSHYLAKRLARPGLKVTRIAHGLPAGSGVEFADDVT